MTEQMALKNRQPVPPDPVVVEALCEVMARAVGDYENRMHCTMSDVISALFTTMFRTIQGVLYDSKPPMTIREQFQLRKTLVHGCGRLWNAAAGGGATSRHKAH